MSLVTRAHGRLVFPRRVRRLVAALANVLPPGAVVADVGAGDGLVARRLLDIRPDLTVRGFDVLLRPETHIPVEHFDGARIPLGDESVDFAMFVDVLHHAADPEALLREGARIARRGVVIKDHVAESGLDRATLRVMDWVGNAGHGVRLTYDYWPGSRWDAVILRMGLRRVAWHPDLGLYPFPASLLFGRRLHFVARLDRGAGGA